MKINGDIYSTIINNRIYLDEEQCGKKYNNKVVFITGGAGTIGKEICRKLITYNVKKVIIYDNSELAIFNMKREHKSEKIDFVFGNVLNKKLLNICFKKYKPNIVIHAAASKHVFIAQDHFYETFECNIKGTINILQMSSLYKVKELVYLSSDKAVNPSNMMGLSKRIGELAVNYFNERTDGFFCIVRFGNVLGSSGSVGQIFDNDIKNNKKVYITDSKMKRYFMSISDAGSLVLGALLLNHHHNNNLYMAIMNEEIYIHDLAARMIEYYNFDDVEIKYSHAIEGESFFEELYHANEFFEKTEIENILACKMESIEDDFLFKVYRLLECMYEQSIDNIVKDIVPEFMIGKKMNAKV